MTLAATLQRSWLSNIRADVLSGIVVALIPEAIGFSATAGVDAKVGLLGALDRLVLNARRHGRAIEIRGLNAASATMVDRFARHRQAAVAE